MREKLTVETDRHIAYLTIYSSSDDDDDENDLINGGGENSSTFDSGTSGGSNKKFYREKKLKEDKIDDGKEEKKEEDQINGKKLQNCLLNGKNIFSSLKDESIPQNIKRKEEDFNTNLQQKNNFIEETSSGYISMLQMNDYNLQSKPCSSQQFQQQIIEHKNISSPKNNKEKLLKEQKEENNNEISEKITFLRRRKGGGGIENNKNNINLQHKYTTQVANRTSVLLIEDRPLPQLPPFITNSDNDEMDEDEEDYERNEQEDLEEPELPVYVNSTNDSGLGGSSFNVPKEYANTKTPTKSIRVSEKIQQVLDSLQVALKNLIQNKVLLIK